MAKKFSIENYVNELYEMGRKGNEEAQLEFIRFLVTETDFPLPDEAEVWLDTLAEKGNGQARRCYFTLAMMGDGEGIDWLKLEQWALAMVEETPGEAYCMLGMLYEPGLPGFVDLKRTVEYYQKAIELGNTGCGLYLARVYVAHEAELGCDPAEIRQLLEQAEPVNPCAQLYGLLAVLCEEADDYAAAMAYYRKWHRLDPEDAECCMGIARNYTLGRGVNLDYETALRYYQKAANLGDPEAMHMVALFYYEGTGVRRNYKRALDFFQRAEALGYPRAAYYLGLIHLRGLARRADKDKGFQYLQACAEAGMPEADVALAMQCAEAAVSVAELEQAAQWVEKAESLIPEDDEMLQRDVEIAQLIIETKRKEFGA